MRAWSCAIVASSNSKGFTPARAAGPPSAASAPADAPRKPRRERSGSSSPRDGPAIGFLRLGGRGARRGRAREAAEEGVHEGLRVALEGEALRREHPVRDEPRDEGECPDRRLARV